MPQHNWRREAAIGASLLLLGCFSIVAAGWLLRERVTHALAVTQQVRARVNQGDLPAACADIAEAATAWESAARLGRPLAPLLHLLGWLPRVGGDLRVAPEALEFARSSSAAGAAGCRLFEPALAASATAERLARAAAALAEHPAEARRIVHDIEQARQAFDAMQPGLAHSQSLAPYRASLETLELRLPAVVEAVEALHEAGPHLPWLLGMDTPRSFLVVLQNPFELRPTGGFIGLVCVVRVEHAQPAVESCRPSEAFSTPAPENVEIPAPYTNYLQLPRYYLRDANWSPDFPTTAKTLQAFWRLNDEPPVDGVIAVDPFALEPMLRALGPATLDEGTRVTAENVVPVLLQRYYDGPTYRDKGGLAGMLPTLLRHGMQVDPARLLAAAAALDTAVQERHLLVAVNAQPLQALLAKHGWDGAVHAGTGHALRIVDADVGYGAVNAFIERLTQYDVAFDGARPATATLTLTYTNHYSPWAEAPTPYAVYGVCTNPATRALERHPGCYADYLRVYAPDESGLMGAEGFEETFDPDRRNGRTVFGGYFRVMPGEQRVIRLRWSLPASTPHTVVVEKQPGTEAPPLRLTVRSADSQTEVYAFGRSDLRFTYDVDELRLRILGPADAAAAAPFARASAFEAGLAHWRGARPDMAVRAWQAGGMLDRALDHARMLAEQGANEDALALVRALKPVATDGRVLFEEASLLEARNKEDGVDDLYRQAGVDDLYRQAAERSPDNPLAQLTWIRRLLASGRPLPPRGDLPVSSSALRQWRRAVSELRVQGRIQDVMLHLETLHYLDPRNGEITLQLADLLLANGRQDAALAYYAALGEQNDIMGHLGRAKRAELEGRRAEAATIYNEAIPLAPSSQICTSIGDGLVRVGDTSAAFRAYTRASELSPANIWLLLHAGDVLRHSDPVAAQTFYERAQKLDPGNGYPDFALGTLLLEHGDRTTAVPLLKSAVAKAPEEARFREKLEEVLQ